LVVVEKAAEKSGQIQLKLTIQDTGIGIPQAMFPRLFSQYQQEDASTTRKFGGTGLGLAICKKLVQMMDGTITVKSEIHIGSTFTVYLWLKDSPEPIPHSLSNPLKGIKILIVTTNESLRNVLAEQLSLWDLVTFMAESSQLGFAALMAAVISGDPFKVSIIDNNVGDGEHLGRKIKSHSELSQIPLILLTSGSSSHSIHISHYFACVLYKPMRPTLLRAALLRLFAPSEMALFNPDVSKTEVMFNNLRVLLVDDNIVNQKVAELFFKKLGCSVAIASNGKEAVSMGERHQHDIIFMDCLMPVMDGYEATREIRKREKGKSRVPIISMSANSMKEDKEKCLQCGMDGFLPKPITKQRLIDCLLTWKQVLNPLSSTN